MLKLDLSHGIGLTHLVTHRQKHKHADVSAQSHIYCFISLQSRSLNRIECRLPLANRDPYSCRRPWRARYRIAKALFVLVRE